MLRHLVITITFVALFTRAGLGEIIVPLPPANDNPDGRPGIVVAPPVRGASNTTPDKASAKVFEQALKFRNGDQLRGALAGLSARDGLLWSRADARASLGFDLTNLAEIQLAPASEAAPGRRAQVHLTNGDILAGELLGVTADTVNLQTAYAGTLRIQRAMVSRLLPTTDSGGVVYRGPNNLDEWRRARGGENIGWTFRKDALIAPAGGGYNVGADVKLPDVASIELDVAWAGYAQFFMVFACDNTDNYYNTDCYALQIGGTSVYLQRGKAGRGMQQLDGGTNYQALQGRTKARITILMNRPKSTVALLIDGKLVKQWNDPDDFTGKGTRIGFNPQGNPIRISNIVVSQWDGQMDTGTGQAPDTEDLVRLLNLDKMTGKLATITGGQAAFATSFATMQIPVERIQEILFAAKNTARPRRQNLDVQVLLPLGNRLTLALDRLDAHSLTGKAEALGDVTVSRAAISTILFNIYEPRQDAEEDDWGAPTGVGRIPIPFRR